jgi:signal transduction histidine kinase
VESDGEQDDQALRPVRIAACIIFVSVAVFLPIDAHYSPAGLSKVLVVYGAHTTLGLVILLASLTRWGARRPDGLALVLASGAAVNTNLYVYVWPHNPVLAANALVCLLMGCAVVFSWSAQRMAFFGLGTFALFALVCTLRASSEGPGETPVPSAVAALGVGGIIAVAGASILGRMRASLAERQSELAAFSARLMAAQEEERRRLARELHDELGQSLTAVNAYLWLIEKEMPEPQAALRGRAGEARRLVSKTLAEMRELSHLLRPSTLDDLGLVPSLDSHLKAFADQHQIATSFDADGLPERLPVEVETALYRIVQEALTNVAKHSGARRVRVTLAREGDALHLEIADDGHGLHIKLGGVRPGIGLVGIRERVHALGGTLTVSSESGVRVSVRVPLPRSA